MRKSSNPSISNSCFIIILTYFLDFTVIFCIVVLKGQFLPFKLNITPLFITAFCKSYLTSINLYISFFFNSCCIRPCPSDIIKLNKVKMIKDFGNILESNRGMRSSYRMKTYSLMYANKYTKAYLLILYSFLVYRLII